MSLTNPLLQEWSGPYGGVPPWDRVVVSDFPEAFVAALADQRASVERIASNPEPSTASATWRRLGAAWPSSTARRDVHGVVATSVAPHFT